MKRYKTALLLLVLLIVLPAGFLLANGFTPGTDAPVIYKHDTDSVTVMAISTEKSGVAFEKKGNGWSMKEPGNYSIDGELVVRAARKLENLQAVRMLQEKSSDLKEYGLDSPRMVVRFNLGNGSGKKLLIGSETPSGYQYYVKDSDRDAIYVVSRSEIDYFRSGDASEFRERNFLTLDRGAIQCLSLDAHGKREFRLEETEPGKWFFFEPCKAEAKKDAVTEILKGIGNLVIKDFIEDAASDLDQYGLKRPEYSLLLKDKSGKSQVIHWGKTDERNGGRYIRLEQGEAVYTVQAEAFRPELLDLGELLNEAPLSIGIGKVKRILIEDRGEQLIFVRDPSTGEDVFSFNGNPVEEEAMNALFVNLMALSSEGYDPGGKRQQPEFKVAFELLEEGKRIELGLSPRDADSWFLTVDGEARPFYVSTQKVELVRRWVRRAAL